ncbi:MAG: hypothetical protein SGARI_007798, partial [Bacillariaceae sp.]
MTLRHYLLLASLCCLSVDNNTVFAFPSGAGGCEGGGPAVRGAHIAGGTESSGNIGVGNYALMIDDIVIPDSANITFQLEGEYDITVMSVEGVPFRGVLIRGDADTNVPGGENGNLFIEPKEDDSLLQVAEVCNAPAIGITHTSRSMKTSVTGLIQYATDADASATEVMGASLEITVVTSLNEFYYTKYLISFVQNV